MPRLGESVRQVVRFVTTNWGYEMTVHWIANIMVGVHLGLGLAVLVGGAYRFPYPTYQPLIDMVHGKTWIWGLWILAAACLALIPTQWPQIVGFWIGMFWQILWGVAFTIAIVEYPTAGATAAVAYWGFAAIDAALLVALVSGLLPPKVANADGG